MALELNYNREYKTLDLVGHLPSGTKKKVMKVMTYNPDLRCYQGHVDKDVLQLAKNLQAIISPDVVNAINEKESLALLKKRHKKITSDHGTQMPLTNNSTDCAHTHPSAFENNVSVKETDEEKLIGYIVKHSSYGYGRILQIENRVVTVSFFSPPSKHNLDQDDICRARALILVGTICETVTGKRCTVKEKEPGNGLDPHIYGVEYENGMIGKLPETELTPVKIEKPRDLLEIMAAQQQEGYPLFEVREELAQAYNTLIRQGVGVKSLLSSRIDLLPHQAYVAGTVVLDSKQRYLLADEVGLGKTIEAGIVIHDLLARNPQANILIICPGILVQQWFSEMYSKFSGVIFSLPELNNTDFLAKKKTQKVILSFHTAQVDYKDKLIAHKWDLVVIDEVHHLLRVRLLYQLVKELSLQDCGLLLLSALPAQHRDQEYYDLLALLEPEQYNQDNSAIRKHFSKLLERQKEIGGRVAVVNHILSELPIQPSRVITQFMALKEVPVLRDDQVLKKYIDRLCTESESFVDDVRQIVHYISDYYRINRRILRNRRERLIETEQLERIQRNHKLLIYETDQYEIDVLSSLNSLLHSMQESGLTENILLPLAKHLYQASVHPSTLLGTLRFSEGNLPPVPLEEGYEEYYDLASYSEWYEQMEYLWSIAKEHVDYELFKEPIRTAELWEKHCETDNTRLKSLISLLEEKHRTQPKDKFMLFAGYPQLASILTNQLGNHFGTGSIARFYYGLHTDHIKERELKEKEVRKFENDPQIWLLVSDETGGEGRNFQFASELIHYDLPFQISKIEQRIGRLDRLGRKRTDVISNLIIAKGSKEEARFDCLARGLEVFNQSISGLEFALRGIEMDIILAHFGDDDQILWDMPLLIKERVKKERALDATQNQMDEASYERTRAEKFRRVQSSKKQDIELESKFTKYFGLVSNRGFTYGYHPDYTKGIIKFLPENIRNIEKLDLTGRKDERKGTFYRDIAQNCPDLEFFSVGNDFFDSVCRSLFTGTTGRTYAVECSVDLPSWMGFEFSYRIKVSSELEHKNFLDHLFALRIEHCFINVNSEIAEQYRDFLKLRRSFDKPNKNRIWKNLTKEKATMLAGYYPNWETLLRSTEEIAQAHIHERYSQILKPEIEVQLNNLDEQIEKLEIAEPDGWKDQIKTLDKLRKALLDTTSTPAWELELDAVGFLSINGGILDA
jgi:ATP-dependent helicase HepA